ncbi:MAG: response regulator transcription factor [Acidimicrobiales bacterium]|nr:response regulator transcription factor [Acidimicrobiales bacterium]
MGETPVLASVLVIEDDGAIGKGLVDELASRSYAVVWARTGAEALDHAGVSVPDAVLLDLGLPDMDGVQVCRSLRRALPSVPIIILTARDAEIDIVVGLDAGATDYVTKPFSVHVLLARLRAHLRNTTDTSPGELVFGDLRIDVEGYRALRDGNEILLRPKEMALLIRLATSAGRVVSREQLLDDVWDLQWESDTKTLEVHMHALRRKLGPRAEGRVWISTVRSFGYRFEP